MTTADGIHPTFSGRYLKLFIISKMCQVVTEIAEVHDDIARSFLKFIRPLFPYKVVSVLNISKMIN